MNRIINNCKQAIRISANLLKNDDNLFLRKYATIADYKINWKRPEKVSNLSPERSGDKGLKVEINPSDFGKMYVESPEWKDASDIVKKMFTLQFLPHKEVYNARRDKILELTKSHEFDKRTPEAQIAILTNKIHYLQELITNQPKNSKMRIKLNELIDKRKKRLKHLRTADYRRFEWVLEKLNLIYKPRPEPPIQITRKESLIRLVEKHCDKLKQDKLNNYRRELKKLQNDFYIEKAEKLAFIREEELACGLKPSVSEEDIEYAKQKARECQT